MKRTPTASQPAPLLVSVRQAAEPHTASPSSWEAFDRELSRQLAQFEHDHPGWLTPQALHKTRRG